MNPPKRIRLLKACRKHLLKRVIITLATDKEVRTIREMDSRISDYYVGMTKPKTLAKNATK